MNVEIRSFCSRSVAVGLVARFYIYCILSSIPFSIILIFPLVCFFQSFIVFLLLFRTYDFIGAVLASSPADLRGPLGWWTWHLTWAIKWSYPCVGKLRPDFKNGVNQGIRTSHIHMYLHRIILQGIFLFSNKFFFNMFYTFLGFL